MNDITLAWSLFNIIGVLASGWLLVRTFRKRQAAAFGTFVGVRLLVAQRIARRNLRDESFKAIFHVCGLTIGLWALSRPAPPPTGDPIDVAFGWLLVGMSGALALSSALNLIDDIWIADTLASGRQASEITPR